MAGRASVDKHARNRLAIPVLIGRLSLILLVLLAPSCPADSVPVPSRESGFRAASAASAGSAGPANSAAASKPVPDSASREDSLTSQSFSQAHALARLKDSLALVDSLRRDSIRTLISRLGSRDSLRLTALQRRLDSIAAADSLRMRHHRISLERLRATSPAFPVRLDGDTLFNVHLRLGSFSAMERAEAISGRLLEIAEEPGTVPDSIKASEGVASTDIVHGEAVLMTVTESDALWFDRGRAEMAAEYAAAMRRAVAAYKEAHALEKLLYRTGRLAAVLMFLAVLLFATWRTARWIRRSLVAARGSKVKGVSLKNVELLSPAQQLGLYMAVIRALEVLAYLCILYLCLPLLFAVIPSTREWAGKPIEWILSPLKSILFGILEFLPDLFKIMVIFAFTRVAVGLARKIFQAIERGALALDGFYADWARPTFNIVRLLAYVLMFIAIFPLLPGSDSPVFRGVSVFLGILFSLGSTSAIANLVAGLVITYMRPFRVGDRVKLGDVTGDVVEKSMLVTRLRTIKNEDITIPNSAVLNSHTINYSSSSGDLGLILNTTVTIGYDAPWRKVHELLIDAALATDGVIKEPKPFVHQTSLDDFYASYQVNAYTRRPAAMAAIYSELHQHIQDRFHAAGIEIMSPHYSALRDGHAAAIPPQKEGVVPPPGAFRVTGNGTAAGRQA
jgi:small-conductance mechanosensitive channel